VKNIYFHDIDKGVEAFSTMRDFELPYPVIQAHQTHQDRIAVIDHPGYTREDLEGIDAMVTNLRGVAIGARTADCIPVLLYDPVHSAVAAVHCGWRGTVLRLSQKTIIKMAEVYGTVPSDLKALIGPGIGPDSFQVGQEVVDAFRTAGFPDRIITDRGKKDTTPGSMAGGLHIDLWEANNWLLTDAGVKPENIKLSAIDTYESVDRFYSARREGIACGRIINAIMLLDD